MRFLIVEDHPLFREALEGALQMVAPAAEILQATSIDGALEQAAAAAELDLILLDLSMPGTTGLSGIIRIRKAFPRIPVVIVSGHQDPQIVAGALSLGVSGYILKSSSKQELAQSIGEVLRGAVCVPAAYRGLVRPQRAAGPAQDLLKRLHELTPQQLRVLEMLKPAEQADRLRAEDLRDHGEGPRLRHPAQAQRAQPHQGHRRDVPDRFRDPGRRRRWPEAGAFAGRSPLGIVWR